MQNLEVFGEERLSILLLASDETQNRGLTLNISINTAKMLTLILQNK